MSSLLNSLPVLEAVVHLPLSGAWHGDFIVDAKAVNGVVGAVAASLADGALALLGTTLRAEMYRGRACARVVGGAHGLGKLLTPKSYRSVPVRTVLQDILTGAGEKLSPTADGATLGTVLSAWTRTGASAGQALNVLVETLACTWRILPNGTVWLGTDAWPRARLGDYQVVERRAHEGVVVLGLTAPTLLPGTLFEGKRVVRVQHQLTAAHTRTEAWFA
jgi:hypothetical protein